MRCNGLQRGVVRAVVLGYQRVGVATGCNRSARLAGLQRRCVVLIQSFLRATKRPAVGLALPIFLHAANPLPLRP